MPLILAGTAPDVYSGYDPARTVAGGYNLDLTPHLKQLNVDTGVFDAGQFAQYVYGGKVYGLPAELATSALAINLGTLDGLGLPYPDPQWDYGAAARFWESATVRSGAPGKQQTGYVYWGQYAAWLPGDFYLRGFGASAVTTEYGTTCGLATPAALQFANWWFPLVQKGAVLWSGAAPHWPTNVVSNFAGSWQLPTYAALGSVKWSFWPQPAWPTGTSAYAGGDYYAVPSTTRHPAHAAAFAVWLTTDTQWQHRLMALQLVVPASSQLWGAWVETVQAIAPPLKGKNVQAFMTAAQLGRAFDDPQFGYDSAAAYALIAKDVPRIAAGRLDPTGGMTQAAQAVNALETGQALLAGTRANLAQAFPTAGPAVAPVVTGI